MEKLTSQTLVPLGAIILIIAFIGGAIWWASDITTKVNSFTKTQEDIEEIKNKQNQMAGQLQEIGRSLGVKNSVSRE